MLTESSTVLHDDLAAILTFAVNKTRPQFLSETGLLEDLISPVSVVAGSRFHLNLRPTAISLVVIGFTGKQVACASLFRAADNVRMTG